MSAPIPKISPADADLLARQVALQTEADAVLDDLGLIARLGVVGRPVRTGSSVLGLMVQRDIDVTVLCPSLDSAAVFAIGGAFASHPNVQRLRFRNDTGRWNMDPDYPDGLYWAVDYRTETGQAWNLDLWFLLEGTTQFDLEHVISLPPRLTPEARMAILRIKDAWNDHPGYGSDIHGYDIYEAVLDHGVRTPDSFETYLRERLG